MSIPDTSSRFRALPPEATPPLSNATAPGRYDAEIRSLHRARLAMVYVRQSSPQQVLHHRESAARQYGLVHRAVALGWPAERVLVIDDDQGQSGGAPTAAPDFSGWSPR